MVTVMGWERENGELVFNGYRVSVWEDGRSSGDWWWRWWPSNVNIHHASEPSTENGSNGKFYVVFILLQFSSVQFCSVAQSCPTLCDPMNCSTPGLPVYYQLPEFTQTHVHRVGDAIQASHPLSSPSPPAPSPSQHQGLFQWVNSSHEAAKVLEFQLQHQSFREYQDWSPWGWTGWISLQSKGLSRVFSNTTVQKHQFFCAQLSSQSNSYIHTWSLEKP